MRNENRAPGHLALVSDGNDFFCIKVGRVLITVITITHARQIQGNRLIPVSIIRRDEIPPVRMGIVAMNKAQPGITGLTPI